MEWRNQQQLFSVLHSQPAIVSAADTSRIRIILPLKVPSSVCFLQRETEFATSTLKRENSLLL